MRATYITACVIGALVIIWLATGQLRESPEPPAINIAEQNRRVAAMAEERPPTRVRVSTIHASEQSRVLIVRGRTQNKRSVMVQSQIGGLLASRPVERGDKVTEGELLCEISIEDRAANLEEAKAAAEQALIEYEGSQQLARQGLQSARAIAQAKARLAAARATVQRRQLELERLRITAPFAGLIEAVHLELGQFVQPGSTCVTLVDLDPMLLIGQVAESDLGHLAVGQTATATLPDGRTISGEVTFVARTADENTRTYPIEIHVDNADYRIPSGVTAQIRIPVEQVIAQKISPALLVLDDRGRMGVRTVNSDNITEFNEIRIVGDEIDGVWVTGLPDVARVIVVGQQLVIAGEEVDPTHVPVDFVSREKSTEAPL